jgi:FkbM family methyltransferase
MDDMVKTHINGKWDLWLTKPRSMREQWDIDNGGWEVKRMEALHDVIATDDVVYYVGSEVGDLAALCQTWGAGMVLFEPNPKVWSGTRAIWEANNLKTPICIEGFASDQTTTWDSDYIYVGKWPENASRPIEGAHGFKELDKEGQSYPQIRIDDVYANKRIPPPTIIALDVEGSEGRVLRGAEQTLAKHRPTIFLSLHPEFLHEQYGEWGAELRKWIIDIGYEETLLEYPMHEVHLMYTGK